MTQEVRMMRRKRPFWLLYVTSFILSFHLFFVVYMNSSFLSSFIDERYVGSIYIISSILSVISLIFIAKLLRIWGNFKTLIIFTILEFLAFLGLAFLDNPYLLTVIFVGYGVLFPLMLYNFDVFLEVYTKQEDEGKVRGAFLTFVNIALILGPLVAGLILTNGDYWKIYLISALLLIPFFILILGFRKFEDPEYHPIRILPTLTCIKGNANLLNVFIGQFLMRFMFSWFVIYMPIYLHAHIGFSWTEIGVMTAIMLLPFALIEYPAGKIADKILGETELLSLGFLISGLFILLIPITTAPDIVYWTLLLLMVRVGASLIEIMTESYFFKHVNGSDNNTISFFRITRPFAYAVGPFVGTIVLFFSDMQYIWVTLGIVILSGVYFTSKLVDTK